MLNWDIFVREQGGYGPVGVGATSVLVQTDGVANAGLGEGGRKGDLSRGGQSMPILLSISTSLLVRGHTDSMTAPVAGS